MKPNDLRLIGVLVFAVFLAGCSSGAPSTSPALAPTLAPTVVPATPAAAPTTARVPAPTVAPTGPPAATKLIVSFSELTPINMALWIAVDQGLFAKNGLDVDARYIESSLGVSALLAGEEQFASLGGSETLAAVLNGADLEVLASFSPVYAYKLEVVSSIKNAEDLRGKKLGVSRYGSSSDTGTRAALRLLGLNPDTDVTLVQVGSLAARTAALLNGSLDGAVTGLPDTMILEDQGLHPLVDLAAEHLPAVNNVLVSRKSWVSANKQVTQAYVDAIVEGIGRAKADKSLALQLMQKYLQERSGNELQMSATYDYDITEVMRIPPVIKPDQFQDSLAMLATTTPQAIDFDINSIIDNSFVEDAVARGVAKPQ